jgi:hypothetical protein
MIRLVTVSWMMPLAIVKLASALKGLPPTKFPEVSHVVVPKTAGADNSAANDKTRPQLICCLQLWVFLLTPAVSSTDPLSSASEYA